MDHMDSPDLQPSAAHKTPRWAKVFAIVGAAAFIVAFVLMHLLGGGMGGH